MTQVFHLEEDSEEELKRQLSLLSMRVRVHGGSVLALRKNASPSGRMLATLVCQMR